jgi:hypothetical protein
MVRENDKVTLVKKGYEGLVGVIDTIYEQGLYIVKLVDDKELVKCLEDDFVVMEKEEDSTPDRENQITISRKDFLEISSEVIAELTNKDRDPMFTIALGLTGAIVSAEIGKRLFNEKGGNNA